MPDGRRILPNGIIQMPVSTGTGAIGCIIRPDHGLIGRSRIIRITAAGRDAVIRRQR